MPTGNECLCVGIIEAAFAGGEGVGDFNLKDKGKISMQSARTKAVAEYWSLIKRKGLFRTLIMQLNALRKENSAVQSYEGNEAYSSIKEKMARIAYTIIGNHPLNGGNQRTGILSMLMFLRLVGIVPEQFVQK